jgi:hypothetical protein
MEREETRSGRKRRLLLDLVRIDLGRPADRLLVLLLVADLVLIGVHLLHVYTPLFADRFYSLLLDRGLGETIRYYKLGLILLALLGLTWSRRGVPYLGWMIVIGLILADDLFGVRAQDFGELVFVGIYLVALVIPVAAAYRFAPAADRRFWWSMVALLSALFVFGLVFDMAYVMVRDWRPILGTLEEGGETIVISLILRLVFATWIAPVARPVGGGGGARS